MNSQSREYPEREAGSVEGLIWEESPRVFIHLGPQSVETLDLSDWSWRDLMEAVAAYEND